MPAYFTQDWAIITNLENTETSIQSDSQLVGNLMGISEDWLLCSFHRRQEFGDSHCSRTQGRVPLQHIQKEVGSAYVARPLPCEPMLLTEGRGRAWTAKILTRCWLIEMYDIGVLLDSCNCKVSSYCALGIQEESTQFPNWCLCFTAFMWYLPRIQPGRVRRPGRFCQNELISHVHHLCQGHPSPFPASPANLVVQIWTLGDHLSHPAEVGGACPTMALKCVWTIFKTLREGSQCSQSTNMCWVLLKKNLCSLIKAHTFPNVSLEDIETARGKYSVQTCTTSWWQSHSSNPRYLAHNPFSNVCDRQNLSLSQCKV